jgi:hypothetical protein
MTNIPIGMKKALHSIFLLAGLSAMLVAGCSTTSSRRLSTASDFDKVFAACKPAVLECGFGITVISAADGFISASRIAWGGATELMQIQVSRDSKGCTVQISVVPQQGESLSSMKKVVDNFTKALRNRVPDVAVTGP